MFAGKIDESDGATEALGSGGGQAEREGGGDRFSSLRGGERNFSGVQQDCKIIFVNFGARWFACCRGPTRSLPGKAFHNLPARA
jgi:hypothetical protein